MHALSPLPQPTFRPAAAYEVLSNTTRRRMLEILRAQGPVEVLDLADQLGISNLKLYNHLNILTDAGLVKLLEVNGVRIAKFRPVAWARLKQQWQAGMRLQTGLSVVR